MRAIDAKNIRIKPEFMHNVCGMAMIRVEDVVRILNEQPTIQPKRGKWERHYSRPNVYADLFWHCSECGYKDSDNYAPVYHHFCPNCGAKMEVTT